MEFCENEIYHVYNRGNNKQLIFFNEGNYHFFKKKIQKELLPFCDVIAYCLMPNHFHLLIRIKENSGLMTRVASNISSSILLSRLTTDLSYTISRKLGTLQSSYSRAIQIQQNLSGSLFQQKIKNKLIENSKSNYLYTCFHYIHQNPVKAGLVEKLESWQFSSFNEYHHQSEGLCNQKIATELDLYNKEDFYKNSYTAIDEQMIESIF